MTPGGLVKQMESEGVRFRIVEEEIEIIGPQNLVRRYLERVTENESAIYEILVERAIFEPLIQPKNAYAVPHYTDAEKNRMLEHYIENVMVQIKSDEFKFEQEIQSRLFRNARERE